MDIGESGINVLWWDDDKLQLDRYVEWLKMAWEKARYGVPIDIREFDDFEAAWSEVKSNAGRYHAIIVDLLEQKEVDGQVVGSRLIQAANAVNPDIAVLVFSRIASDYKTSDNNDNSHVIMLKDVVDNDMDNTELLGGLLGALSNKQIDPRDFSKISIVFDEDNIPLRATISGIGEQTIRALLLSQVGPSCKSCQVGYISPGLSGATVLRMKTKSEPVKDGKYSPRLRDYLLKISRDRESIENEQLNYRLFDEQEFPENLFVRLRQDTKLLSSHGWHGFFIPFKDDAITLGSWLETETNPVSTLGQLFLGEGLGGVYRNTRKDTEVRPNVSISSDLSDWRKSAIRWSVSELRDIIFKVEKNHATKWFDESSINNFLLSGRFGEIDENRVVKGSVQVTTHGDLHSKNILVNIENGRGILIDPANIGHRHWANDAARLLTDLVAVGIDSGTNSLEWCHFEEWKDYCGRVIRGERVSEVERFGEGHVKAVDWLRSSAREIVGEPFREWEFVLSLAAQFLRCGYRRHDVTAPKRGLSIIAGCYALNYAYELFPVDSKID